MDNWKKHVLWKTKQNKNILFTVGLIEQEAIALFAGGGYNQCAV